MTPDPGPRASGGVRRAAHRARRTPSAGPVLRPIGLMRRPCHGGVGLYFDLRQGMFPVTGLPVLWDGDA